MKRYFLKQGVFQIKDKYKVYNENKEVLYNMISKLFSLSGKTKIIETATNRHIYTLNKKIFRILPVYYLKDPSGKRIAKIKKRISILTQKMTIESIYGDFKIRGDIYAYTFEIFKGEEQVVAVRKKVISFGDTYEIAIFDEEMAEFYVALVLMLDKMFHDNRSKRKKR
ncbi:MAG: LURP-one-related/scramblase family protein [Bacilli bacterium]|jgi:uncharacterized protein YxjI